MKNAVRIGAVVLSLSFAGGVLADNTANTPLGSSKQAKFSEVDTNRDGSISQAEAQAHAGLNTHFATLDADRDGALSQTEFGKWDAQGRSGDAMPAPAERAPSGQVPRAELDTAAPQSESAAPQADSVVE